MNSNQCQFPEAAYQTLLLKHLAQGHKCHDRDSSPSLLLTTPELESSELDRAQPRHTISLSVLSTTLNILV